MTPEEKFLDQLKNFDAESQAAAAYLYSFMTIDHAASRSRKLLNRLNRTPSFWLAVRAGLQSAAFISLARVFDQGSTYNINQLLRSAQSNAVMFSRPALGTRKQQAAAVAPPWLPHYLASAYYPTVADFRRIRKLVAAKRRVFDKAIKPARDKYYAHREMVDPTGIGQLFSDARIRDIWRIALFLRQLHDALWELYHNGRKPRLRPMRYSIPAMFRKPPTGSSPLEELVRQTQRLMAHLESGPPIADRPKRRRPEGRG